MYTRTILLSTLLIGIGLTAYWFLAVRPSGPAEPRVIVLGTADSDSAATQLEAATDSPAKEPQVIIEPTPKTAIPAGRPEQPAEPEKPAAAQNVANPSGITQSLVSWGFTQSSGRTIDTIIIHTSYNALGGDEFDRKKLIEEYRQYGVAPHYLIDRDGKVFQLVADKNIAYHAGTGQTPDGRDGVNNFSLGIEVMNTQETKFTADQYTALNSLLSSLKNNYKIKYILGHSDIAPGRKSDPWNIEWNKVKK